MSVWELLLLLAWSFELVPAVDCAFSGVAGLLDDDGVGGGCACSPAAPADDEGVETWGCLAREVMGQGRRGLRHCAETRRSKDDEPGYDNMERVSRDLSVIWSIAPCLHSNVRRYGELVSYDNANGHFTVRGRGGGIITVRRPVPTIVPSFPPSKDAECRFTRARVSPRNPSDNWLRHWEH